MKFKRKGDGVEIVLDGEWSVSTEELEVWEDVTAECFWRYESFDFKPYLEHSNREIACTLEAKGYRLRKMRLFDHGQIQTATAFDPVVQYAFIVERKKP